MLNETLEQSADDLAEARAKVEAVLSSLAGLDDDQVRHAMKRLERIEAELARLEGVVAGQGTAMG